MNINIWTKNYWVRGAIIGGLISTFVVLLALTNSEILFIPFIILQIPLFLLTKIIPLSFGHECWALICGPTNVILPMTVASWIIIGALMGKIVDIKKSKRLK